jgi:hypothetical protein
MSSPPVARGSFKDEGQKLRTCEENLRRNHQLVLYANRMIARFIDSGRAQDMRRNLRDHEFRRAA